MEKNCTVYRTSSFIGKRWTLPILLEVYKGEKKSRRYSELKKRIPGITPKVLSTRLKELESLGLVKKEMDVSKFPIKCEYKLTKQGNEFITIIKGIKKWALKWNIKNAKCDLTKCEVCEF